MNTRAVRRAIAERITDVVPGVQVHTHPPGALPHTPAVVIVRQSYDIFEPFGAAAPNTRWNLVALCDATDVSKGDDLDNIVDNIVDALSDPDALSVGSVKVIDVGDEDRIDVGGAWYYAATLRCEVIT